MCIEVRRCEIEVNCCCLVFPITVWTLCHKSLVFSMRPEKLDLFCKMISFPILRDKASACSIWPRHEVVFLSEHELYIQSDEWRILTCDCDVSYGVKHIQYCNKFVVKLVEF